MTSTPARQAIGMYCARGMRKRKMSSSTTAWMMPATGVRPPLLMLVIVRAMAPVAGMPPKSGEARFATPWAMSSVLLEWRAPMTPSATVADSSDSMAPRMAMVMAGDTRPLMVSHDRAGTVAPGSWLDIEKRSPMVSMVVTPAYCFSSRATMVITIMAISEPGSFPRNEERGRSPVSFGHKAMRATLPMPTAALQQSMVVKAPP